jgi:outer membrane murein-binding lipoprotein Lpp
MMRIQAGKIMLMVGAVVCTVLTLTGCSVGPRNVGKDKWVINAAGSNLTKAPLAAAIDDLNEQSKPLCPNGFTVLGVKDKDFHDGTYLTTYRFRALINCNAESTKTAGCSNCDDGYHGDVIKKREHTILEDF